VQSSLKDVCCLLRRSPAVLRYTVGHGALDEMVSHHKEKLVLIRSAQRGLIMQQLHHANEVRDFDAIGKGNSARLTPEGVRARHRIDRELSNPEFEPEAYTDPYRTKVLSMFEEKSKAGRSRSRRARIGDRYPNGAQAEPGRKPSRARRFRTK
jgi:non-homologous end joining protein Ku